MSVGDLFYRSALINALIFLWLASLVSTVRIFVRRNGKLSTAMVLGAIFGPLALIFAWMMPGKGALKKATPDGNKYLPVDIRSWLAIMVASTLIGGLFYQLFVSDYQTTTISNELMLRNMAIFVMVGGVVGGLILSAFTFRVAFFEAVWTVFCFSLVGLMLKDWPEEAFAHATSSTYFMTLMVTATMLLLIFLTLGGSLGYLFFGEGRPNFSFGYENFIGTRFLMTKRSSQMVSLITIISVIAVMIACSGMIVVMSVMNGFSSDLRTKILGANAHLMVLKYGKDFIEYNRVIDETKHIPGIAGASAFIVNEGMISSNRNLSGSIITGLDLQRVQESGRLKYVSDKALAYLKNPSDIPKVTEIASPDDLALQPFAPEPTLPGVIIGKEMASDLQVMLGDVVNLISPVGEIGPTGPIPRAKPFRVAGFLNSGMYDFDSKFSYIALSDAQNFFIQASVNTALVNNSFVKFSHIYHWYVDDLGSAQGSIFYDFCGGPIGNFWCVTFDRTGHAHFPNGADFGGGGSWAFTQTPLPIIPPNAFVLSADLSVPVAGLRWIGPTAPGSGLIIGIQKTDTDNLQSVKLSYSGDCSSSASPAVCGAAATGNAAIANPATTIQINTTAVTANSKIFIFEDSTLGTKLGVTCNATLGRTYMVTTRTAGASFIVTASATPAANSACLSYMVTP